MHISGKRAKQKLYQSLRFGHADALIFFDRYSPKLLGMTRQWFKNEELATDVLGEIFVTLFEKHNVVTEDKLMKLAREIMIKRFLALTPEEKAMLLKFFREL